MKNLKFKPSKKLVNIFTASAAFFSLSACVYSDAYGGYTQDYSDEQYCDPYNEYDAYYGCDVENGLANFGYEGGWHKDYFYPGYGVFLFDRDGYRHRMNDYFVGYWAHQRHQYFRTLFYERRYSGKRFRSYPRHSNQKAHKKRQDGEYYRGSKQRHGFYDRPGSKSKKPISSPKRQRSTVRAETAKPSPISSPKRQRSTLRAETAKPSPISSPKSVKPSKPKRGKPVAAPLKEVPKTAKPKTAKPKTAKPKILRPKKSKSRNRFERPRS